MAVAIVSGCGGLVGAESVERLTEAGFDVVGVENDMRARFFGPEATVAPVSQRLVARYPDFRLLDFDVRDRDAVERLFAAEGSKIELVVHAAAQPSHDWAASDPHTDFGVNAVATLNLLEAFRRHAHGATFVFMSTNKVYGDTPNHLPLVEQETRLSLPAGHVWENGIDTSMSIDRSTHSLFGVSKASADMLVQEYGRYFDLATVCFRAGCISGANHAGARLHGFLSYLARCVATGTPYTIYGYGGKQVRDNIHSSDLVDAFLAFHAAPRPAAVYNIGGGPTSNCSVLEAIAICERLTGRALEYTFDETPRVGDHRWWISDLREFEGDYPDWSLRMTIEDILVEILELNADRWRAAS